MHLIRNNNDNATTTVKFLDFEEEQQNTLVKFDLNDTLSVKSCLKEPGTNIQCDYPADHSKPDTYVSVNGERYCTDWKQTKSRSFVAGPTWIRLESKIFYLQP